MPQLLTGAPWTRRRFLAHGFCVSAAIGAPRSSCAELRPGVPGDVGVNVSSFTRQIRTKEAGQHVDPFDLPRILRDEVNVRIIDLVSTTLNTREHRTLGRFRASAEAAGCTITNLKVNEQNLPFDGQDPAERRRARDEYKRWIDAAVVLGARWLRPFPAIIKPDWDTLVDGYRELAEYAEPRGITLLIENFRWLEKEPDAIPRLVAALRGHVAAQPDTGNWFDDATRRTGLARAFPHAASADFKVQKLGPAGEHPAYDLRVCFELGYAAGFRGPWCIEHLHQDRATLIRELRDIVTQLRAWIAEKQRP